MQPQMRLPLTRLRPALPDEPVRAVARPALPELTLAQRENLRRLPRHIVSGLRILRDGQPPRLTRNDVWAEIATDAIMLAADGWAKRAFDQGWAEHDVFGCAADPKGNDDLLGLAGYLRTRSIRQITSFSVVVADRTADTAIYRRQHHGLRVFLWEYGR